MSEPLLVATDLEREYRIGPEPVRVLKGASLTVNVGETVAVIGASGVGKSTLLHILGTLDRPTSGRVLFASEDVFARSEAGLARLRRSDVGAASLRVVCSADARSSVDGSTVSVGVISWKPITRPCAFSIAAWIAGSLARSRIAS